MNDLMQLIVSGLLIGVSYGVLAAGLALIFGVMKIINFAHADFAVLAMYIPAFFFLNWWGIDPFLSVVIAMPLFFLFGYGMQRFLIDKVMGSSEDAEEAETATLIITLGLALVVGNIMLMVFSGAPRMIDQPYTSAAWNVSGVYINKAQTYSFFISLGLIFALFWFLNKTMAGKAVQAAADDPESCAYMGISYRFVCGLAFGLGTAITAAGGCLLATYRPFNPFYGESIIIILFASVVLGGITSITGALLGALIIGLLQQVSSLFFSLALQNVAVFALFVLFLYLRPQGILGKRARTV